MTVKQNNEKLAKELAKHGWVEDKEEGIALVKKIRAMGWQPAPGPPIMILNDFTLEDTQ